MLVFTQVLQTTRERASPSVWQRWLQGAKALGGVGCSCLLPAFCTQALARRQAATAEALRALVAQVFPVQLDGTAEIREIARLRDGGLLWATIPPTGMLAPLQERQMPATAIALTAKGRRLLAENALAGDPLAFGCAASAAT